MQKKTSGYHEFICKNNNRQCMYNYLLSNGINQCTIGKRDEDVYMWNV